MFIIWTFPELNHRHTNQRFGFSIIYLIETILCLVIFDDVNTLNMMSVVLYNTAHELILKVNKLYRYKVLKTVMDVHPRNLF